MHHMGVAAIAEEDIVLPFVEVAARADDAGDNCIITELLAGAGDPDRVEPGPRIIVVVGGEGPKADGFVEGFDAFRLLAIEFIVAWGGGAAAHHRVAGAKGGKGG